MCNLGKPDSRLRVTDIAETLREDLKAELLSYSDIEDCLRKSKKAYYFCRIFMYWGYNHPVIDQLVSTCIKKFGKPEYHPFPEFGDSEGLDKYLQYAIYSNDNVLLNSIFLGGENEKKRQNDFLNNGFAASV